MADSQAWLPLASKADALDRHFSSFSLHWPLRSQLFLQERASQALAQPTTSHVTTLNCMPSIVEWWCSRSTSAFAAAGRKEMDGSTLGFKTTA